MVRPKGSKLIILIVLLRLVNLAWSADLEVHIIDVGQGDCTLIVSPTGKTVLIDSGTGTKAEAVVNPYLNALGLTTLDYLVATHYDRDHIAGVDEVIKELGGISHIITAVYDRGGSKDGSIFDTYKNAVGTKRNTIYPEDVIDLGGGVTLTCIAAGGHTKQGQVYFKDDENELSVVLTLSYFDFQMYLGGDIGENMEPFIGYLSGDMDVYKVSHHGSKYSSTQVFLQEITSEVSTISVGSNSYGHPTSEVINRLINLNNYIYQTEPGNNQPPPGFGEVANGTFKIVTDGYSYIVSGSDLHTTKWYTDGSYSPTGYPKISLSKTQLYFGAVKGNLYLTTAAQTVNVSNSGSGNLYWTTSTSQPLWLKVGPYSGTNSGVIGISVLNHVNLSTGTYNGNVLVTDPNASNSPQTVNVILTVYGSGRSLPPFGTFETPKEDSTVSGSIPVTGWVLDDVEVEKVNIYRKNGINLVYIGKAIFVEGARPDVQAAYPDYPNNTKAGWGYMMLTNFLPNGGNGTFTLYAIAFDVEGHEVTLGTKTITVDNANAVKPFGAIDTPYQGGDASGNYVNWGWVLTPIPNSIPTDGSTINVWVDGVNLGNPIYNIYRSDISNKFPGYANSDGAVGYFFLDTTAYDNGTHTIQWTATDNAGNSDGIGSRYFTIQNTGADTRASAAIGYGQLAIGELPRIEVDNTQPIFIQKGFRDDGFEKVVYPDDNGEVNIKIKELEPLRIKLNEDYLIVACYLKIARVLRKIPAGMSIKDNCINWMPGVAFLGNYQFWAVLMDKNGDLSRKLFNITIEPK